MIQVVDVAIWSIEAESPHNDIMKRPAALGEFRRLVRSTFNLIKARTRRARRHQRPPRDARLGRGTGRADVAEKMIAARKAGATPWELHERAHTGEFAPAQPIDPRILL
jgi:hypothetical protein